MIELAQAILAAAEHASHGDWHVSPTDAAKVSTRHLPGRSLGHDVCVVCGDAEDPADAAMMAGDAAYIAACNPKGLRLILQEYLALKGARRA